MVMQRMLLFGLIAFGCVGVWAADDAIASALGAARKTTSKAVRDYKNLLKSIDDRLPLELSTEAGGSARSDLVDFPHIILRLGFDVRWPDLGGGSICWSPGDEYAAYVSRKGAVNVVVPFTGEVKAVFGHTKGPWRMSWGPNNQLAVGYDDGQICIWDVPTGSIVKTLLLPRPDLTTSLQWGSGDIVSCDSAGNAFRWDSQRDFELREISRQTKMGFLDVTYLGWSHDKRHLLCKTFSSHYYLYAVADGSFSQVGRLVGDQDNWVMHAGVFWSMDDQFIVYEDRRVSRGSASTVLSICDLSLQKSYALQIPTKDYSDHFFAALGWGAGNLLVVKKFLSVGARFMLFDSYGNKLLEEDLQVSDFGNIAFSARGDHLVVHCVIDGNDVARIFSLNLGYLSIQERAVLKNVNAALADPKQKFVLLAGGELSHELFKKLWPLVITVKEICDIAIKQIEDKELTDREQNVLGKIARFDVPLLHEAREELMLVLQKISEQCGHRAFGADAGKGVAELTDAELAVLLRYPALHALIAPYVVSAVGREVVKERAAQAVVAREARERAEELVKQQEALDDFAMSIAP